MHQMNIHMHRNTFIHSPSVLNRNFSVKNNQRLFFAGQITGVEGYVESAASGLLAAIAVADDILERPPFVLDDTTVCGALQTYIATPNKDFQPMNANFGIIRPLCKKVKGGKSARNQALSERALSDLDEFLSKDEFFQ